MIQTTSNLEFEIENVKVQFNLKGTKIFLDKYIL